MAEASRLPEVAKEMKCLPAGEAALPAPMSSVELASSTRKRGKGLERRSFALISRDTKIKRRGRALRATKKYTKYLLRNVLLSNSNREST
ncbi:hypothetical protein ALC56_08577 [Trachymyrmex septentrionalis]|uniref:Uncharacterized protein n=1 Tax=Trachymyrmex septentrionalis TaxID=34720 RepID=A0A195F8S9_9HYME|nr:hypothetical protein ALC56_08577 [Trachymyrmex septentrionalis]